VRLRTLKIGLDGVAKKRIPAPSGNRSPVVQPVSIVTILTELHVFKIK